MSDINSKTHCKNFDCENKYWCKRYVTELHENYDTVPNLKDLCNKQNKYELYKHWKEGINK